MPTGSRSPDALGAPVPRTPSGPRSRKPLAARLCREIPQALCYFPGLPCAPLQAAGPYSVPPQHRLPKQCKDSFLVEQVFSPHPYPASLKAHMKNDPLYADMRLTELAEVKRGPPSWTIEEYARNAGDKGKLTALDLQVSLAWSRAAGGGTPHTPAHAGGTLPSGAPGPPPRDSEP